MKILLVDDENDIRKIGLRCLQALGKFETLSASSADEAIICAKEHKPDVILMDMMMPGKDGLGAMKEIMADPELATIPVIFMTAKVQPHEVEDYVSRGAIGVIQKPFDPMTLSKDVKAVLANADDPRNNLISSTG